MAYSLGGGLGRRVDRTYGSFLVGPRKRIGHEIGLALHVPYVRGKLRNVAQLVLLLDGLRVGLFIN